ncbi:MAG: ABC transporter ATP-binding protein [Treponema sp.]|nr:ABC transporter ATP-binding protein [Treponema sp.]
MNLRMLNPIIGKLRGLLNRKQKLYLITLFMLTIVLSIVETAGVSVIMPFISVASNPNLIDTGYYKKFFDLLGFVSKTNFIIVFGITIVCFYIFRAVYNVIYTYILNLFSLGMFRHFATTLFKTYLTIPYKVYVQKNSAELMQIIINEAGNVSQLLLNMLQMGSELFTVLLLYSFMVMVNWQMTLVLTAILVLAVLFILQYLIRKSKAQGIKRADAQLNLSHTLGETFGNFKFVKLKGNEARIFRVFEESTRALSRAQTISQTLGSLPKNILESAGFSLLVAAVVFILWYYHSADRVIPIIAMYALALYRILPALNRMLTNVNQVVYLQRSLDIVYDNIHQATEHEGAASLVFKKSIRVENLSFKYMVGTDVLNNVSLEIRKGEKIAIVGESGGGKSTLVDLIIGINKPSSGVIYIDDMAITNENIRAWRSKIGYIPQSIYLFDGTVAENVVFGSEQNDERLMEVLQMANIWNFLLQKEGLHTRVGEGGIQLSGGQKQRIGIARALYCDPEVLVLDEATSALDNDTESKIMDEIYKVSENKTLIVIAHRLTTVERCERRIAIENGEIVG